MGFIKQDLVAAVVYLVRVAGRAKNPFMFNPIRICPKDVKK